eukprot:snap_masked-scaffold_18-processed-gene-4.2-mRNA-1 protein AED:1.00 eAED:1.00 QI:0/-1/0/0/-1/1/1/0/167
MTLNCSLNQQREPVVEDEVFLLRRGGIRGELLAPDLPPLSSEGTLYLSSRRIVFVSSKEKVFGKAEDELKLNSFNIQLRDLYQEKFNQPIFGCNNLSGKVRGSMDVFFKFHFQIAAAAIFLKVFSRTMYVIRNDSSNLSHKKNLARECQEAFAVGDSADPSVIYLKG